MCIRHGSAYALSMVYLKIYLSAHHQMVSAKAGDAHLHGSACLLQMLINKTTLTWTSWIVGAPIILYLLDLSVALPKRLRWDQAQPLHPLSRLDSLICHRKTRMSVSEKKWCLWQSVCRWLRTCGGLPICTPLQLGSSILGHIWCGFIITLMRI